MGHGLKASSNSELIDKMVQRGFLVPSDLYFIEKVKSVDRCLFAPRLDPANIYDNSPVRFSRSAKSCMSTPQLHAQILSLLSSRLCPGRTAMEIGCGTGYLPAVMGALGCDKVFAIENDPDLLESARYYFRKSDSIVVQRDVPTEIRFDAVYVSPYFSSLELLDHFLSRDIFSSDAVVVAVYQDNQSHADQQLVYIQRKSQSQWEKQKLFRVLCEAFK